MSILRKFLLRFNLVRPKTIFEKIDFLIAANIDLLEERFNKEVLLAFEYIVDDIHLLRYINKLDLKNKLVDMPTINQHTIHKTTYSSWCTDKGYIISNRKDIFKIWLEESKKLLLNYEYGITQMGNGKYMANTLRYKPYCVNIYNIVEDVYEIYQQ